MNACVEDSVRSLLLWYEKRKSLYFKNCRNNDITKSAKEDKQVVECQKPREDQGESSRRRRHPSCITHWRSLPVNGQRITCTFYCALWMLPNLVRRTHSSPCPFGALSAVFLRMHWVSHWMPSATPSPVNPEVGRTMHSRPPMLSALSAKIGFTSRTPMHSDEGK